jgi:hypothetical protein
MLTLETRLVKFIGEWRLMATQGDPDAYTIDRVDPRRFEVTPMLRAIFQAVFGRRDEPTGAAQPHRQETPTWREAPTKTWVDDIGSGLVATVSVTTGHHGFVQVVGESHYQDELRTLVARLGSDGIFTARLVPEPNNPHDTKAVAVVIDEQNGGKVGYLARQIAQTYQQRLLNHKSTVTCPARLTGTGFSAVGVVLDFEAVRDALGLPRVSVDQSDMDYEATAEYHRLNGANREFVKETRPLETSDPQQAVAHYREAIVALRRCRDLARERDLEKYGFLVNQTDALPLDRLVRCLLKWATPMPRWPSSLTL